MKKSITDLTEGKLVINGVESFAFQSIISKHTYSMVQSPSWAANWFPASQEIPRISRNPKVHHRTHKRTPPVPILGRNITIKIYRTIILHVILYGCETGGGGGT